MMRKILLILIISLIAFNIKMFAQPFSNNSFKVGAGIGIMEGLKETGMGTIFSLGYQKSLWKDRLRINPNIMVGGFTPVVITDVRDQYIRITSLGFNGFLDAIKYKSVSIFIGTGGFLNYSRGLLGTGGWPESGNTSSQYFFKMYYGGYLTGGLRINPPKSRIAYELMPLNFCFGNDQFFIGFFKFGIDIKLNDNN
jgi:hypothetical protein